MISTIDEFLKGFDGIISFVALVISIIALFESQQKSKIILKYKTKDSKEYKEYKEKKCFRYEKSAAELLLKWENEGNVIGIETDLDLIIENTSSIVAKNPVVNLRFVNLILKSSNFYVDDIEVEKAYNWCQIETGNNYSEFRWEPKDGTVIHKGISIIEKFNINTVQILEPNTYIEVILSADNMKTKNFNIPIKIINK